MNGSKLLDELARRFKKRNRLKSISDSALAKKLGVSQAALANYKRPRLTVRQVANLIEKYGKSAEQQVIDRSVAPIVEFLHLAPALPQRGGRRRLFSTGGANGNPPIPRRA